MEFFSKDTLFNDLPQNIKQKIINIRNMSVHPKKISLVSFKEFSHTTVPSSKGLIDDFLKMGKAYKKLENFDATEGLKKELEEFEEFVNFYRMEVNNKDFVSEMEKTVGMMEDKFEKLNKDFNL